MAAQEALISVPIQHAGWLTHAFQRAGLTVLDTGDRVTTEDRIAAEAVLCIARFEAPSREQVSVSLSW